LVSPNAGGPAGPLAGWIVGIIGSLSYLCPSQLPQICALDVGSTWVPFVVWLSWQIGKNIVLFKNWTARKM